MPLDDQGASQIRVSGSVVRAERDRAAARGDGRIEIALGLEGHGQAVPRFGIIGPQLQRLAIGRDRLLRSPLSLQDDA